MYLYSSHQLIFFSNDGSECAAPNSRIATGYKSLKFGVDFHIALNILPELERNGLSLQPAAPKM